MSPKKQINLFGVRGDAAEEKTKKRLKKKKEVRKFPSVRKISCTIANQGVRALFQGDHWSQGCPQLSASKETETSVLYYKDLISANNLNMPRSGFFLELLIKAQLVNILILAL